MVEKRKRTSRWQALLKLMSVCLCSPKVFRVLVWVGRAAYLLWKIWQKFKDDLWSFYEIDWESHAERRPQVDASLSRHVANQFGGQARYFKIVFERN